MPPLKSLYTPIFNANHPSSSSSSNSTPISIPSTTNYIQTLSRLHLSLASLPPSYELPESRPSSPNTVRRVEKRCQELKRLFEYCDGDTSSGKWGLVWENVRMGCTRAYRVVRVGEQSPDNHQERRDGEEGEWLLPETEAEWEEWERRCKHEDRVKMKVEMWKKGMDGDDGEGQSMEVELPQSLKELYENRIEEAMAEVGVEPRKEKAPEQAKKNDLSTLGFPVVKRSSFAVAAVAGKNALQKGKERDIRSKVPRGPPLSEDISMSSPEIVPKPITDLAEIYLPPSFPTELPTSTPKCLRQKPPLIPQLPAQISPMLSDPPSLPLSYSMPPPGEIQANGTSSPQLGKRPRALTPAETTTTTQELYGGAPTSPPPKKARTTPEPISSSNDRAVVSPSQPTPPGLGFRPTSPVRENGLVLGNAKGIPEPSTPDRGKPLPTLTDLIASSRKSKPRVRPPSRKKLNPFIQDGDKSPTKGKAQERPTTPIMEISPAKSLLSTPASGEESTSDIHISPRPISFPIAAISDPFAQNPIVFAPETHSTQQNHPDYNHLFHPPSGSIVPSLQYGGMGSTIGRGSSGAWGGGGYNSQFDVEGQIDRVSELLERDVDFDGWLKEMPPDPEDEE